MKRFALAFVSIMVAVCLLFGCADNYPLGQTVTYEDLQITLPGDFIDLSAEDIDADADFLYGWKTLIVKGAAEDKTKLQKMTLEEYTSAVISGNRLQTTPRAFGKGYQFTYETAVGDRMYTYITVTFEGESNFWLLQFYCPTEDLQKNQQEINRIVENIQVK